VFGADWAFIVQGIIGQLKLHYLVETDLEALPGWADAALCGSSAPTFGSLELFRPGVAFGGMHVPGGGEEPRKCTVALGFHLARDGRDRLGS
jgi:hypothetical protein